MTKHPAQEAWGQGEVPTGIAPGPDVADVTEEYTVLVVPAISGIMTRNLERTKLVIVHDADGYSLYRYDPTNTDAEDGVNVVWDSEDRPFVLIGGVTSVSGAISRVRVVTTSNVNLSSALAAGQTSDGKTLVEGDVVLVAAQTSSAQNGVYLVPASGAASRHPAFTTYNSIAGAYFSVMEGTNNADTLWRCTSDYGGTIDSTALSIAQFTLSTTVRTVDDGDVSAGDIAIAVSDAVVLIDVTQAVNLVVPSAASFAGESLTFKDIAGNAATYNMTPKFDGAETCDGLAGSAFVISSNYGWVTFYKKPGGSGWYQRSA